MRQYNGPTSRPAPGDRNPLTVLGSTATTATAPHGVTSRATYTVPAGKKCLLCACSGNFVRQTAAAPVGLYEVFWRITNIAAGTSRFVEITSLDNTVAAHDQFNCTSRMTLQPGESLDGMTADASTGGTTALYVGWTGVQYDA